MTEPKPGIKLAGRTPADPQVGLIDQIAALLPTPVAQDDGKSPEAHMAMKQRMAGGPRDQITSLSVMARQAGATGRWDAALLPTPTTGYTGTTAGGMEGPQAGGQRSAPGDVGRLGASGCGPAPDTDGQGREGPAAPEGGWGRPGDGGGQALPPRTLEAYEWWRVEHADDGYEDAGGFLWPYGHREDWAAPANATEARRGPRQGSGPRAVPGVEEPERPAGEPGRHDRGDRGGPVEWGAYGPAIARHAAAIGRHAPHPVDGKGRLNPVFVEWMMMLPAGWVTDIVTNRSKALKALGNGVVPPQAAYALRSLLQGVPAVSAPR